MLASISSLSVLADGHVADGGGVAQDLAVDGDLVMGDDGRLFLLGSGLLGFLGLGGFFGGGLGFVGLVGRFLLGGGGDGEH